MAVRFTQEGKFNLYASSSSIVTKKDKQNITVESVTSATKFIECQQ